VSTIHDLTPVIFPAWHQIHRVLSSKMLFPKLIRDSDRIIAISHHTKSDIIRYYRVPEQKISVIHHGASDNYRKMDPQIVDLIRQKYHLNNPFALFVGTLEPRKNIPTLLKSFALCKKKNPDLKLVIVGHKGWKYAEVFTTIADLHLEKEIIFLHYVPHEDLPAIYNAAELFVYPSLYEGFGLPPLEAMQCGIPVITSNTSSLPEIIGNGGIMVDPLDIQDLADKMSLLLTDNQSRQDNIRYNLSRCQQFSWEKCARQTAEVYEEIYDKN
jgi:glycosyltransferase involved in cell wall biosynthesis